MSERVLLKLGGSVITEKGKEGVIRSDAIEKIAKTLAEQKDLALMVVHGAGSCGHPEAIQYGVASGVSLENRAGIYVTHMAVRSLNDHLVSLFRRNGIEAVGVQPLSAFVAENGRLHRPDISNLECMLDLGIVPVLHGDMVMDRARGACVVSGDQLVRALAPPLRMQRIGMATDVPGVLSGNSVIPEISPESATSLDLGLSNHADVTGGMRGKVRELCELSLEGIPSEIFHVSRLDDFLHHRPHGGTVVRCPGHA